MKTIAPLVSLLLLAGACGGRPAARDAQHLIVAEPGDGYGLGGDAELGLYPVNTTIYEPLVRLSADFRPEPLLATHWELLPPNTWRFHLRRDVRFHDGSPLTASAVRWTMERMARRRPGATGVAPGSTRVVDDSTVDITPVFANRRLPEQLVHPVYGIMAPGSDPTRHPIGTGPFRFVEYRPSDHITVARFDGYWGGRALLSGITFRFVPDPATRVLSLRAGEVDLVAEFPREVSDPRAVRSPVSGYEALYVSLHGRPPYDLGSDRLVRRAIAGAVDRARIARDVWSGAADPTPTVVPAAALGVFAARIRGAAYDPGAARALLDEAGWHVGTGGVRVRGSRRLELTLVVGFPNPQIHRPMPELMQNVLREIGVDVHILQVPDDAAWQARIESGEGDLWAEAGGQNDANPCFLAQLLFYSGPRLRPSGYARLFAPGAPLDRFVDACREADRREDVERNAADAEHVLVDETFVIIPLAATRRVWGVGNQVRGFEPHPSSLSQRWDRVCLAQTLRCKQDQGHPIRDSR
ncbi:MAG: ABC transporter substrate-binding protein [Gemmatimonadota bacterium]|nr:ABC transporter substrate-binding protein [Gemmatimonadota bacterium]